MPKLSNLVVYFMEYAIVDIETTGGFGAKNKITDIQDKVGIERQANVIALLIFKSGQVRLIERYPIKTTTQCINLRDYARKKRSLKYQCVDVEANIISGRITKILKVNKVLK